jgi:hypothetical protein
MSLRTVALGPIFNLLNLPLSAVRAFETARCYFAGLVFAVGYKQEMCLLAFYH